MPDGPFGLFSWWQLNMVANAVNTIACFGMIGYVVTALARRHQLTSNKLAVASVVVFFVFGAQRALQLYYQVTGLLGPSGATFATHFASTWYLAGTQTLIACVAIYYCLRNKAYGRLLIKALLFDSFEQRQRVEALEAQQGLLQARADAERERDEQRAMSQAIVRNSRALIYVKDLDGHYLLVNREFERVFAVPQADLLGHRDDEVSAALPTHWGQYDVLAQRGVHVTEDFSDHPDGRRVYDATRFPLYDGEATVYATCGVIDDVTDQRHAAQAEAESREAAMAATAAKSAFLATMSHEIRTPMNAVIGMTDLLMDTSLDEQQREFLDTIRSSGDTLMTVINDILDFSKIEARELRLEATPFDLRDEMEGCLDLVVTAATRKRLSLGCYVHESCPPRLLGDAVRIRQIVGNLLSNAVKFTEQGEVVVTVTAAPEGDQVRVTIEVTDTGIGISVEGQERLFKSFSQVDASTTRVYGGTGLGLAISQRLAQAMGGDLTVVSTPGVGSAFCCTLLLAPGQSSETDDTKAAEAAEVLTGKRALLVDDNPTNLRILDLQLSSLGMICTTRQSPEAALVVVAGGYHYDVAILDMHMPNMDGLELGLALRRRRDTGSAPLVLLSSVGSRPEDFEKCFSAFHSKPAKSAALRDTLVRLLSEQARTKADEEPEEDRTRPLRVLLVEDNPVNQRVAQLMLTRLGHLVTTVDNGQEAVYAADQENFDVVLMDLQMPLMDGLEATRRILVSQPDPPRPYIVALTASALVEDRNACAAAGMDNYLGKPVKTHELEEMLDQAVSTSAV